VALYFREDAPLIGPPAAAVRAASSPPAGPEHELLRARLSEGPCFFTDLLAELDAPPEALREALWDLVWAGEATNDAWAPLRAPHLTLARGGRSGGVAPRSARTAASGRSRFAGRRPRTHSQVQGRWSLTGSIFGAGQQGAAGPAEQRRALAELLLERYGIVTREQVLAEGIKGGFAMLYDTFANLETLGVCRRGYFIEGMGGAQFALPGAVERLRGSAERGRTVVLAAADPAQPYGGALPWPRREGQERRPARVAGSYVVLVADEPILYVERGGRGLVTLAGGPAAGEEDPLGEALRALADAVRAGRVPKLALERIDGEPAIASRHAADLIELGFQSGPRRLTLTA
jgi:ATP-dependent Lhr-like helicase